MSRADGSTRPTVLVLAGPNGSGKTTLGNGLIPFGVYVNADDLKKEYGGTDLEAARQATALRETLVENRADFSFETVLSTKRNLELLRKAKRSGYVVQVIYVLTCDENINVARVMARRAAGGHDVPEGKIRNRYHRSLAQLPQLLDLGDKILIYDNSVAPVLLFQMENGEAALFPNDLWPEADLRKLLKKDF